MTNLDSLRQQSFIWKRTVEVCVMAAGSYQHKLYRMLHVLADERSQRLLITLLSLRGEVSSNNIVILIVKGDTFYQTFRDIRYVSVLRLQLTTQSRMQLNHFIVFLEQLSLLVTSDKVVVQSLGAPALDLYFAEQHLSIQDLLFGIRRLLTLNYQNNLNKSIKRVLS